MRYAIFALIASVMLGCSSYHRVESQCFQIYPLGQFGFIKFNQCTGSAELIPMTSLFKEMQEKSVAQ